MTGPPAAPLGLEVPFTITVTNTGRVETQSMTVRSAVPEGLQYLRSDPPAVADGNQLAWTLGALQGGQSHNIQVVYRSTRLGAVTNCANVATAEGLRAENCATTQITAPQLKVSKTGPTNGTVGLPITYQITVTNPGSGPAANVVLSDQFDAGLEHESRANPVEMKIGTLAANESRTVSLALTPRQAGRLVNRVVATADGDLKDQAEHPVTVQAASMTINMTGPALRYVKKEAVFDIKVTNQGDVAVNNVVVRNQLPVELGFVRASDGGQLTEGQVVLWNLGTLEPRHEKVLQVTASCQRIVQKGLLLAMATADGGLQVQAESPIEILGIPAFRLEVVDTDDPIMVGGKTSYKIAVTNTGTLAGKGVEITAIVPKQMKLINATGPAKPLIEQPGADGQRIKFPVVETLEPQQTANYSIEVEALQAGDIRFKVELRSDSNPQTKTDPIIEEESTIVYPPKPN
jgi:uncharacterized repeat protein (TIGR01451 family)